MKALLILFGILCIKFCSNAQETGEGVIVNSIELIEYHTLDGSPVSGKIYRNELSNADKNHIMSASYVGVPSSIQKSIDGGKTWSTAYQHKYRAIYDISHPDPMIAIAVGDSGMILRTKDGGKTWDEKFSGAMTGLRHVEMFDAFHGIIGHIPEGIFLITKDGGETWIKAAIPKEILPPVFGVASLFYPFENHIIAHLQWKEDNWVLTSPDGGENWTIKKMNIVPGSITVVSKDIFFGGGFKRYNPSDPNDIRRYTQIIRSTNGGETWELVLDTLVSDSSRINSVVFLNSNVGIAAGTSNSFYFTKDGGESWIRDTSIKSKLHGPGNEGFTELTVLSSGTLLSRNNAGVLRITLINPTSVLDITNPYAGISTVFPNPTSETLRIQLPDDFSGVSTVTIYTILGETVYQNQRVRFNDEINVDKFLNGMYVYRIIGSSGLKLTGTFIVKH